MMSWFNALMPKEDAFFGLFSRHAETLVMGAEALRQLLEGGERVPEWCVRVSEYEHQADLITAEVMQTVRKSFITPFDRSDIQALAASLDDSIDQMHKTAKAVTLYEVREFTPHMRELGDTIVEAAKLTVEALPLMRKLGPNQSRLLQLTEQLVKVEGRSDDLYDQGMKALYKSSRQDAMAYIVGAEIYDHLEKVVDRFEDVGNRINSIVIEHV
jgi:predicted phosphate transport protein (TIGR00153 family)